MEITKTLYVTERGEWRRWLKDNDRHEPEIWLVFYRKDSGKPRLAYTDAVEEAICFGWIDGIEKKIDKDGSAQRFTPRRAKSHWSELNKERARQMIERGLMTRAGLARLGNVLETDFQIPADILNMLQVDRQTWRNFELFPKSYQRIRIGYIEEVRRQPAEFRKRLAHFLKRTAQNKKLGTIP